MSAAARPLRVTLASLALLTWCSACRVGDPLVDKVPVPPGGGIYVANCNVEEEGTESVTCDKPPATSISATSTRPLRWQTCPVTCGTTQTDLESDDAGQSDELAGPLSCLPTESIDSAAFSSFTCASKRFVVEPLPATATHATNTISAVQWQDFNVVLEAEAPAELIIARSELSHVRLHLTGPVTVRFQDMTTLVDVSISSASPDARVVFDDVAPEGLTVGDSTLPFAGHIEARHSELMEASLVIESAELDSAFLTRTFASIQELVSNDGVLRDVALSLGHALFAPTEMIDVEIQRCETLSIFGSQLSKVTIPHCTGGEPTRLYASSQLGGSIDGVVHGDSSRIQGVRFGQNGPSDFVFWGVSVLDSAFCDEIESVKVSANGIKCSTCTERAFDPLKKGCILPGDEFDIIEFGGRSNFCDALDMLEPCRDPLPVRSRPVPD